jgi:hypothetical protein
VLVELQPRCRACDHAGERGLAHLQWVTPHKVARCYCNLPSIKLNFST